MGAVRAFASAAAAALGIWAAADGEPAHAQDMMRGVDLSSPDMTMSEMSRADVEALLAKGRPRDFSAKRLSGLDLSGLDLSGVNLRAARLNAAPISPAPNLDGATLDPGLGAEGRYSWREPQVRAFVRDTVTGGGSVEGRPLRRAHRGATCRRRSSSAQSLSEPTGARTRRTSRWASCARCSSPPTSSSADLRGSESRPRRPRIREIERRGSDRRVAEGGRGRGADLRGARLDGANLTGLDVDSARIDAGAAPSFATAKNAGRVLKE